MKDTSTNKVYIANGYTRASAADGDVPFLRDTTSTSTSSGEIGSCYVGYADICASYSSMTQTQYNEQESKCLNGNSSWAKGNACATKYTSSSGRTNICQQTYEGAVIKTYSYNLSDDRYDFAVEACKQYQ